MRTLLKAVIVGCSFTILLVVLVVICAETKIGKAAIFLMIPGIQIGFMLGSGRVHDISFWLFTVILNAIFYSLLLYGIFCVGRFLQARHSVD
jgi:hypothetical protein